MKIPDITGLQSVAKDAPVEIYLANTVHEELIKIDGNYDRVDVSDPNHPRLIIETLDANNPERAMPLLGNDFAIRRVDEIEPYPEPGAEPTRKTVYFNPDVETPYTPDRHTSARGSRLFRNDASGKHLVAIAP